MYKNSCRSCLYKKLCPDSISICDDCKLSDSCEDASDPPMNCVNKQPKTDTRIKE